MNWKGYLLLFSLALITIIAFIVFQSAPGYMDAEYYYAMGLRIARDQTFSEPFAWNFLNGYKGLPQPGFGFWMPLPAFIAGLSMILSNGFEFSNARIGFILIAAIIPILTAEIAFKISGKKRVGLIAGLFCVFPGFYAPFLTTTDSFGLMMLFGGMYFVIARQNHGKWKYFLLGLLSGLMHLTRADGFIWLVPAILIAADDRKAALKRIVTLIFGYLSVMIPWFTRNWFVLGSLLPAGNARMFWIRSYNDLFLYRADLLTFTSWFDQGVSSILYSISKAFLSNLQTAIFVQGQIVLFPLILIGFIQYKRDKILRSGLLTWFLVLFVMTAVFPFAGSRGGFFHSGAALQPVLWVLAAVGMDRFIDWGIENRNWKADQAHPTLVTGFLVILLGVTVFVHIDRVLGKYPEDIQWNRSYLAAVEVDRKLEQMNISRHQLVMINNPPGLYIASRRPSLTIPSGGMDEVIEAAGDAGAEILILEKNHPESLDFIYKNPGQYGGLKLIETVDGIQYYKILPEGDQ